MNFKDWLVAQFDYATPIGMIIVITVASLFGSILTFMLFIFIGYPYSIFIFLTFLCSYIFYRFKKDTKK
jgi:hypothetical protein